MHSRPVVSGITSTSLAVLQRPTSTSIAADYSTPRRWHGRLKHRKLGARNDISASRQRDFAIAKHPNSVVFHRRHIEHRRFVVIAIRFECAPLYSAIRHFSALEDKPRNQRTERFARSADGTGSCDVFKDLPGNRGHKLIGSISRAIPK